MLIFLLHGLLLIGASLGSARALVRQAADRFLATAVIVWTNIVVTCLLLSGLRLLGDPHWFFRTSLALALATWLAVRRMNLAPEAPAPPITAGDRISRQLLLAFVVTLAPLAYLSIRIAGTYVPNNYDSLAYHLPRAMFYLGQNSLAHFVTGNDRQVYFPFNYNLLQLFGLIYSPPLQCLNFINLAAWVTAGVAIYRLCRLCALTANSALVATWVALTSTQVLAQATATTNDLPTAAALLCTLTFILRWRAAGQKRDALLAGLGAGLAAGSKLTVMFFGPPAGLIIAILAWQHWRRGGIHRLLRATGAWLVPAVLAFVLSAPFALINLAAKGVWVSKTYDYTLNRPFSLACAAQTAKAYLIQLFLEPLHRFTFDLTFTAQLNAWAKQTFFPRWNDAYAFSPLYLFPPDLNEDHVWFGFAGPLILVCALFCLVRGRRQAPPIVWMAGLGVGWLATYFTLNKWSLYNQRYMVLAILIMSPSVAACIDAGRAVPFFRRATRDLMVVLAFTSVWLCAIYLCQNTSRPYAPLWAGNPPPPALPSLPPLLARRMAEQPRVNIESSGTNERTFLLMAVGHHQRFTAFHRVDARSYNVFSEWGFVRKVAFTNIEQPSSFTVVKIPTKRTAGVEFLGTIGSGTDAQDYYGLVPHADQVTSGEGDRNALVEFFYKPREPRRYEPLLIRAVGLNAPDQARLLVGVEYEDHSTATLATFTAAGEVRTAVTKPFRRFTLRVEAQDGGRGLGAVDLPRLYRNLPANYEAPDDPSLLFVDELVVPHPEPHFLTEGLASPEGPYPQWDLPLIRWAKAPVTRIEIPATDQMARMEVTFSLRLGTRDAADIDVVFNGQLIKGYHVPGGAYWFTQTLSLIPQPGKNVLEFRNVSVSNEPDWEDYLNRNPDVKAYVVSLKVPPDQGAKEHWDSFGRHETRTLQMKRQTVSLGSSEPLYYQFRQLRLTAYRNP